MEHNIDSKINEKENNKVKKAMKRKMFYVWSEVWNSDIGAKARLVFTYLCRCANAKGECFPSITTIAEGCGVSGSTVKRAMKELVACGAVTVEERYLITRNGRRRTTNLYRVPVSYPEERIAEEALQAQPQIAPQEVDDGLEDLIERLNLRSYEGELSDMLVMTMEEMWQKPYTVIAGERIPREAVRARLEKLTGDAVYNAIEALSRLDIVNPAAYFRTCLYNAPIENAAKATAFGKKLRAYGLREAL